MAKQLYILIAIALVLVAIIYLVMALTARDTGETGSRIVQEPGTASSQPPGELLLPFEISDIDNTRGEVNPLGVVRFSKDKPEFGHSGIDFPLTKSAPIYAVADGPIVNIKSAGDPWGGQGIYQLIQPAARAGEGWAYIYEHVTPQAHLKIGDEVKAGQLIATKTPPAGFTAHFQLSYIFNNYEFTRGMECWPDYLSSTASTELNAWWDIVRVSDKLATSWRNNDEEGAFPFRGLLDSSKFPAGPQLCYPPGTDVR